MEKKATLASVNARPAPEEVAFERYERRYEYERYDVFRNSKKVSHSLDCGIVSVSTIRTPIGPLIHIYPKGQRITVEELKLV